MKNASFKPPLFEDLTPGKESSSEAEAPLKKQQILPGDEIKVSSFDLEDFEQKNIFAQKDLSKDSLAHVKFEAGRFMEEGTLLTNVEEYSKSVREDADLYAKRVREEAELIKSEIETELANGRLLLQKTKEECAALVQEAEDSRDQIRQEAHDEGFEAGFAQGKLDHQAANAELVSQVEKLLHEMNNMKISLSQEYESQLANMSLIVAQKIIHLELSERQGLIVTMLQESLHQFEGMDHIRIRVNPAEYEFLIQHKEEIQAYAEEGHTLSFKSDPNISPAGALIESDHAQINLQLNEQFTLMAEQIQNCIAERKSVFRHQPHPEPSPQAVDEVPPTQEEEPLPNLEPKAV